MYLQFFLVFEFGEGVLKNNKISYSSMSSFGETGKLSANEAFLRNRQFCHNKKFDFFRFVSTP